VKRASSSTTTNRAVGGGAWSRRSSGVMIGVALAATVLGACGGDDDDADDSSSTTTTLSVATTDRTAATTTTTDAAATTTTTIAAAPDYVTEGAGVVVANASGIDGAAGRLSERLVAVGFTVGPATNGTDSNLAVSKIYYDPANPQALPVAESLREAFGGGEIELLEMGAPPPVESGDIGGATIVVAMGDDIADKSLEELQGRAPATTADTADETTSDETTSEETTDEETTGEETAEETTTTTGG
jgi:hypothetical protein